jgi:hypothetical protein
MNDKKKGKLITGFDSLEDAQLTTIEADKSIHYRNDIPVEDVTLKQKAVDSKKKELHEQ